MRLPDKNSNIEQLESKIKDFVDKSRKDKSKTDSVYVLNCKRPNSKEEAIETSRQLLEEYSNNGDIKYRDPNKEVDNNTNTRPDSFKEALNTETSNMKDDLYISYPYWIEKCYEVENIFYVGWSNTVVERITDHITDDGALFTKIFPPVKIEEIRWYPSKKMAKKAEGSVADEYSDIKSDTNIYEDKIKKYAYYF